GQRDVEAVVGAGDGAAIFAPIAGPLLEAAHLGRGLTELALRGHRALDEALDLDFRRAVALRHAAAVALLLRVVVDVVLWTIQGDSVGVVVEREAESARLIVLHGAR